MFFQTSERITLLGRPWHVFPWNYILYHKVMGARCWLTLLDKRKSGCPQWKLFTWLSKVRETACYCRKYPQPPWNDWTVLALLATNRLRSKIWKGQIVHNTNAHQHTDFPYRWLRQEPGTWTRVICLRSWRCQSSPKKFYCASKIKETACYSRK